MASAMPSGVDLDHDFRNRIQPAVNAAVQVADATIRIRIADDTPMEVHTAIGIVTGHDCKQCLEQNPKMIQKAKKRKVI